MVTGDGMAERQNGRMKRLSRRQTLQLARQTPLVTGDPPVPAATIDRVAAHRMADRLQMNPNLVCAAAVQLEPQEIGRSQGCNRHNFGTSSPAILPNRHSFPVVVVGPQPRVNAALLVQMK